MRCARRRMSTMDDRDVLRGSLARFSISRCTSSYLLCAPGAKLLRERRGCPRGAQLGAATPACASRLGDFLQVRLEQLVLELQLAEERLQRLERLLLVPEGLGTYLLPECEAVTQDTNRLASVRARLRPHKPAAGQRDARHGGRCLPRAQEAPCITALLADSLQLRVSFLGRLGQPRLDRLLVPVILPHHVPAPPATPGRSPLVSALCTCQRKQ